MYASALSAQLTDLQNVKTQTWGKRYYENVIMRLSLSVRESIKCSNVHAVN